MIEHGRPLYRRIIVKFTGEIFKNGDNYLSEDSAVAAAKEIKDANDLGLQIAVVLGGGNLVRGRNFANSKYLEATSADYMGMGATIINGIMFEGILKAHGLEPRLMSTLAIKSVAEEYLYKVARSHLDKGRVVIQVGGSGRSNFTTDATAILLAEDLKADAVLKATKVDGVFDKDPMIHPDAKLLPEVTAEQIWHQNLKVIERSALVGERHRVPIHVFNIFKPGNLRRLLLGEPIGSRIIF